MSERRDYGVCHNVGTLLIYRQDGRGVKPSLLYLVLMGYGIAPTSCLFFPEKRR